MFEICDVGGATQWMDFVCYNFFSFFLMERRRTLCVCFMYNCVSHSVRRMSLLVLFIFDRYTFGSFSFFVGRLEKNIQFSLSRSRSLSLTRRGSLLFEF